MKNLFLSCIYFPFLSSFLTLSLFLLHTHTKTNVHVSYNTTWQGAYSMCRSEATACQSNTQTHTSQQTQLKGVWHWPTDMCSDIGRSGHTHFFSACFPFFFLHWGAIKATVLSEHTETLRLPASLLRHSHTCLFGHSAEQKENEQSDFTHQTHGKQHKNKTVKKKKKKLTQTFENSSLI